MSFSKRHRRMTTASAIVYIIMLTAGVRCTYLAGQQCGIGDLENLIDTSKTYTYTESATGQIKVCLKCPPGSYRLSDRHCTDSNSIDHCQCCPTSTFKYTYDQATSCAMCRSDCPYHNAKAIKECSRVHDIICACDAGFFFHKDYDDCVEHALCELGKGVLFVGTNESDTDCEECEENITFSNSSSKTEKCQPCSKCNTEHEILTNCIPTMDTVCKLSQKDPEWKTGVAIGTAVGLLIFVAVIVAVCFCWCKQRKDHDDHTEPEKNQLSELDESGNSVGPISEWTKRPTDPEMEKFRKIFDMISRKCDPNWRFLIRQLPWRSSIDPDAVIRYLEGKYHDNLYEQQYNALWRFRKTTAGLTPELFVTYLPDSMAQLQEEANLILNMYNNTEEDGQDVETNS